MEIVGYYRAGFSWEEALKRAGVEERRVDEWGLRPIIEEYLGLSDEVWGKEKEAYREEIERKRAKDGVDRVDISRKEMEGILGGIIKSKGLPKKDVLSAASLLIKLKGWDKRVEKEDSGKFAKDLAFLLSKGDGEEE